MYCKTVIKANRVDKWYRFPLIYLCITHDRAIWVEYWFFLAVSSHSYIGHCTKAAFNGVPLTRQQNAISMAFRWWADGGPILVAFRSSLIIPSDKMIWIRACMQFVWTATVDEHIISWDFGTYNMRQRLRRACARVHSQYSIDGSVMSSITTFKWINFVSHDSNHNLEKGPFVYKYLLSKFTQLFNAVVCMAFFKVITSTVTCKCSILTTRQRMT